MQTETSETQQDVRKENETSEKNYEELIEVIKAGMPIIERLLDTVID